MKRSGPDCLLGRQWCFSMSRAGSLAYFQTLFSSKQNSITHNLTNLWEEIHYLSEDSLFSLIQFLSWLNSSPLLVFLTNFPLVLSPLLCSSFPIFSHVSGGSSQILSRFVLHPLQSVITMKVDMGIGLPSNCTCSSCFRGRVFFAVFFHLSLILQPASFLYFSFYFC